jgi:hypothetical protein
MKIFHGCLPSLKPRSTLFVNFKIQGWAKVGLQLFVWKKDIEVKIITVALLIAIIRRRRQIIKINNTIINKQIIIQE